MLIGAAVVAIYGACGRRGFEARSAPDAPDVTDVGMLDVLPDVPPDAPLACVTSAITAGATTTTAIMALTGLTLARPVGVVQGDLLVAGFTQNSPTVLTPPTGWIAIDSASVNFVYYKVAGATEPNNYVWTFSLPTYASAVMTRFTGMFCGTPPLDTQSSAPGYTATSITTTVNDELLVLIYSSGSGAQTWTTPVEFTADYLGGQNSTSTSLFHRTLPVAGPTGDKAAIPSVIDGGGRAYFLGFR